MCNALTLRIRLAISYSIREISFRYTDLRFSLVKYIKTHVCNYFSKPNSLIQYNK